MTLAHQLSRLESSGLIRLAAVQPEVEYTFRHTLVQDAAYASLVKADRQLIHRAVGEALESAYPDRLEELAPRLGQHFSEAGQDARALKYFTLAGDAASGRYALPEAVALYSRALEIAHRESTAGHPAPLLHLYTRLGRALEISGRHEQAVATYADMQAAAGRLGDRSLELAALMALATVRAVPSSVMDPAKGQALSEQALHLAHELGDRPAEARILWNRMLLELRTGRPRESVRYGEQSLEIARQLGLREQMAYALTDLGSAYAFAGQVARAQAARDEARQLWQEMGNLPMLANVLSDSIMNLAFTEADEQAIAASQEAYRISRSIGNPWGQAYSLRWVGEIYAERGQIRKAIETMEECIRLSEQAGFMVPQVVVRASLALVYRSLGAFDRGFEVLSRASPFVDRVPSWWGPQLQSASALLYLSRGSLAEAEAALGQSPRAFVPEGLPWLAPIRAEAELSLARRDYAAVVSGMDRYLALAREAGHRVRSLYLLDYKGQALLAQGHGDAALEALAEARAIAERQGYHLSLWPILTALSRIEAGRGRHAEAQALRRQAREIVTHIADHAPAELRTSFLALPHIRAIVEDES